MLAAIGLIPGISVTSCSTTQERRERLAQFSIQVPRGIDLERQAPIHDFDVIRFADRKHIVLRAYVGPHPSWPPSEDLLHVLDGTSSALQKFDVSGTDASGAHFRDVLARSTASDKYPTYVHFWYTNSSVREATVANRIIDSISIAASK